MRRVIPRKRVTTPTWGPPRPCKLAVNATRQAVGEIIGYIGYFNLKRFVFVLVIIGFGSCGEWMCIYSVN